MELQLLCTHKIKLANAGYESTEDLKNVHVTELSKEIDIPPVEAVEILRIVRKPVDSTFDQNQPDKIVVCDSELHEAGTSALDLLRDEENLNHIVTSCYHIDDMLGGGVPVGKVTELCGAPGIGKTQLCIQLAVDATIPSAFGGLGGETVYIDTEGSFIIERVVQIANATVQHIEMVAKSSGDKAIENEASHYTLETILSRIHYFRCYSYIQLIALINTLHQFISKHSQVCTVIVDSIAAPFRHGFKDLGLRNRLLSGLAQNFIKLATQFHLAVVLTNQMTTRSYGNSGKDSQLVPALGESWGHACTIRLILYWEGNQRLILLYKSPSHREMVVAFQITKDGVRDIPVTENTGTQIPIVCSQHIEDDFDDEQEGMFQQAFDYMYDDIVTDSTDNEKEPSSKRQRTAEP